MKIRIFLGLFVVLGASFISVCAADTPAQAIARAALEQKLYNLDHPQTQLPSATNTPSGTVAVRPGEPGGAMTPQTTSAATTPAAAPVMWLLLLSLLSANLVVLLVLLFRQKRYRQSLSSESWPYA